MSEVQDYPSRLSDPASRKFETFSYLPELTQEQIQEELVSGNLEQKLRDLNPEAGPLLDDIAQAMKSHPNAENLPHILDGLAGPAK